MSDLVRIDVCVHHVETTASDDLKTTHEDSYLGFFCVLRNGKDLACSHDITESFVGAP